MFNAKKLLESLNGSEVMQGERRKVSELVGQTVSLNMVDVVKNNKDKYDKNRTESAVFTVLEVENAYYYATGMLEKMIISARNEWTSDDLPNRNPDDWKIAFRGAKIAIDMQTSANGNQYYRYRYVVD